MSRPSKDTRLSPSVFKMSEELLLTPKEIIANREKHIDPNTNVLPVGVTKLEWLSAKAQLAKAEPLIQREVLDWLLTKLRQLERKYDSNDAEAQGWIGTLFDLVRQVGKEGCIESAEEIFRKQLLSEEGVKASIDSIIKRERAEARKAERERIFTILEAGCGHFDRDWMECAVCEECWQSLKGGKDGG